MQQELEPLEVSYAITKKDVKSYLDDYLAYAQKSPLPHLHLTEMGALLYNLIVYGVPALVFGLAVIQLSSLSLPLILSPFGFYLWIWLVGRVQYYRGLLGLYRTRGFVAECRACVDKEGFTVRDTVTAWTIFWSHIADITVTRHYILLVGSPEAGGAVPAIPLHAFTSRQEAEQFVERSIRLWKSAHDTTPGSNE